MGPMQMCKSFFRAHMQVWNQKSEGVYVSSLLTDVTKRRSKGFAAAAATAAKSLPSCPTLRPQRWQPTRLPHSWDSPGKNAGVGCHFLLQCMKVKSERKSLSRVQLLATPWTAVYQAPLSVGFSRHEYQSGVPFSLPGDLPDPGVEPGSLALQADFLLSSSGIPKRNLKIWGFANFAW